MTKTWADTEKAMLNPGDEVVLVHYYTGVSLGRKGVVKSYDGKYYTVKWHDAFKLSSGWGRNQLKLVEYRERKNPFEAYLKKK